MSLVSLVGGANECMSVYGARCMWCVSKVSVCMEGIDIRSSVVAVAVAVAVVAHGRRESDSIQD